MADRVGLGWRGDLAAGILANLDRIDLVELVVDDYLEASRRSWRALRTLKAQVPLVAHSISLGPASASPVPKERLDNVARLLGFLEPMQWSEHLAFVRSGGVEIGHLTAPPRTERSVECTVQNIDSITRVVGLTPAMENIATLIDPPLSMITEPQWISDIIQAARCPLLLDLHNVYANCCNFGQPIGEFLSKLPLECVTLIHLSGGRWISSSASPGEGAYRLLDDHLHDVPDPVFVLLEEVAARVSQPLTVIIERDGAYPEMIHLLEQLDSARAALRRGRIRRSSLQHSHYELQF